MPKFFLSILITFTIFVNLQSQSLWNGQGHIPQVYQLEWTTAGLLANTPKIADHFYKVTDPVFDDGDNSNYDGEINDAIDSAKNDGGVLYCTPKVKTVFRLIRFSVFSCGIFNFIPFFEFCRA